jgi:hypothetical protein
MSLIDIRSHQLFPVLDASVGRERPAIPALLRQRRTQPRGKRRMKGDRIKRLIGARPTKEFQIE